MKKTMLTAFLSILFSAGLCIADSYYAQQNIFYKVLPLNEMWVSSAFPPPLVIDTTVAGEPPGEAVDDSTTYCIVTNEGRYSSPEKPKKITGKLNEPMPEHTYLKVSLAAPVDAESIGAVELGTDPQDLVTGILGPGEELTITYRFGATAQAGTLSGYRIVTFTLVDDT
jgi:hypothetical protein